MRLKNSNTNNVERRWKLNTKRGDAAIRSHQMSACGLTAGTQWPRYTWMFDYAWWYHSRNIDQSCWTLIYWLTLECKRPWNRSLLRLPPGGWKGLACESLHLMTTHDRNRWTLFCQLSTKYMLVLEQHQNIHRKHSSIWVVIDHMIIFVRVNCRSWC